MLLELLHTNYSTTANNLLCKSHLSQRFFEKIGLFVICFVCVNFRMHVNVCLSHVSLAC